MISVDEDHVRKDFRLKVIINWDDIVVFCGNDRATIEGAKIDVEVVEIMIAPHNEPNDIDLRKLPSFVDVPHTRKPTTPKDVIANSLAKMASSFQGSIVYDKVNVIPNLREEEQIKACAWLIENDKKFLMIWYCCLLHEVHKIVFIIFLTLVLFSKILVRIKVFNVMKVC
ncbi:hypothetical protein D8674_020356 [Pyrus ussuriensis x Pyrus communis]|uniref:Uncharacterized protein n=1 Tax=Pyrus ussuriensis x Pyrus communis TaxID=2448454 RepID=A0A5N5HGH4_9ROSA|nr:hypothetical protein D8674_020356 [Pyrus ussuriensis x Pyrus communis]